MATESLSSAHSDLNQETKGEYRGTFAGPDESKVPESFVWPDDLKGSQEVPVLNVPHIDLNKFLSGNESDVEEVTRLVDEACRKHGFFVVVNHGVDMKVMESLHECMSEFFSMPMDVKQRAHRKFGENFGYAYSFFVRFSSNLPWKETLSLPCVADGENSSSAYDYLIEKLGPTFSHHGKAYQECGIALNELGTKIVELLGLSLGISREYFKNFYKDNDSILRLNYYPTCDKPEVVLGTGPHTDPTSVTILHQDPVSGLQVCSNDQWYSIPPNPEAFVINIGDTFTSLTNGIYKGCIHRAVVNSMNARKSLAFFLCPSHDKVVRAPEELVEKSPPRKYPDYKWPMLLEMTQKRYRPDCNTLEAFKTWVQEGKALDTGSTITAPSA
ncbi:gibberellin 20 oxidase 1-like isoform X2 [Cucurbita maxima]|uniref:Gibberellin 20 oxidase 1-like isoform X2 n=1 Tax=Cucurbita maxima TaxID=3661 RepID=A0A6J1HWU5_CUCMA|nr:gibberellin 20 oxidase 1-like isoform X2 [Cucurbita maxima]